MKRIVGIALALSLAPLVQPPGSAAAESQFPAPATAELQKTNVILMKPGQSYTVQMAGKPAEAKLVRVDIPPENPWTTPTSRNQLYINGTVVRDYTFYDIDGDDSGDVFLVKVTTTDTLVYQYNLTAEGQVFVSSVVFRFDGSKLVDATRRDSDGLGHGWFKLDRRYDSSAGAGRIETRFAGITNSCSYAKNKVSCTEAVPLPKIAGTLRVGKTLSIRKQNHLEGSYILWYRCTKKSLNGCNGISKGGNPADKATYKLTKADRKKRITVCLDYGYEHWKDDVCAKVSGKVQ